MGRYTNCLKSKLETKKDGSIFIWSLFMLIVIFMFSGLFFSYINMTENYVKADDIIETVGKTRVQAIDVPMKEQYGHIEVINDGYGVSEYDFISDSEYEYKPDEVRAAGSGVNAEITPGYDKPVRNQSDPNYTDAVNIANATAINTGLMSLENRIKNFGEQGAFIKATENNFCIEVFPLPSGDSDVIPSISCATPNGDVVEAKDVKVNGYEHDLNNNTSADIDNKRLRVYNAVFVGFAYEDTESLFYKYFDGMFNLDAPIRKVHRIVYPQIDAHSFDSEGW